MQRRMLNPSARAVSARPRTSAPAHRNLSPPSGRCLLLSTAGWLHGLDLSPVDPVEVTVQQAQMSNRTGVQIRRATLSAGEVARLRGLPVTSALRTAVDLGSRKPLVEAVVALEMAVNKRLVRVTELRSFIDANRGAKRIATLRRAI